MHSWGFAFFSRPQWFQTLVWAEVVVGPAAPKGTSVSAQAIPQRQPSHAKQEENPSLQTVSYGVTWEHAALANVLES